MNDIPTAVFLSGGGRTLANLIQARQQQGLPVDFRLVISSKASAGGIQIARDAGIETRVVRRADSPDDQAYQEAMFGPCREVGAKLVLMAGYLKHVLIPDDYHGRVLNIHPSLIPAFCGAGMYGARVHQAAIDKGVKVSGCTVHLVDNHYDNGPIIVQRTCAVLPDDTAETLAARVFEQECLAFPEAIRELVGRWSK